MVLRALGLGGGSVTQNIDILNEMTAEATFDAMFTVRNECKTVVSGLQHLYFECPDPGQGYRDCLALSTQGNGFDSSLCALFQTGTLYDTYMSLCTASDITQTLNMSVTSTCHFDNEDDIRAMQDLVSNELDKIRDTIASIDFEEMTEKVVEGIKGIPAPRLSGAAAFWGGKVTQNFELTNRLKVDVRANLDLQFVNEMLTAVQAAQSIVARSYSLQGISQKMGVEVVAEMIVGKLKDSSSEYEDTIRTLATNMKEMDDLIKELQDEAEEIQAKSSQAMWIGIGILVVVLVLVFVMVTIKSNRAAARDRAEMAMLLRSAM